MIGTYCEPEFLAKIDAARGFKSRSQFCREAIREALLARGVAVEEKEIMPRDTVGRPKKRLVEDIDLGGPRATVSFAQNHH